MFGVHREAVTAAGLDGGLHAEGTGEVVEPRAGGDDRRVVRLLGDDDLVALLADRADAYAADDAAAALDDGVGQGGDVLAGVDEALVVQADAGADGSGERRLDRAGLVAGEGLELDALAGRVDVLDLVEEDLAVLDGLVRGDEGAGLVRGGGDATLVEAVGGTIVVVPGEVANRKITDPADLVVAEAVLAARTS